MNWQEFTAFLVLATAMSFSPGPNTMLSTAMAANHGLRRTLRFCLAAALQFVNIKAWMLALAIVSGWIAGRPDPAMRFAVVLPVMLFYAFTSNLVYALVGSLLRDWLAGPDGSGQRLLVFNRVMAGVLVATALWMLAL